MEAWYEVVVNIKEAISAARELRNSFNGGKPYDFNEITPNRAEYDLYILAGSLVSRLESNPPDLKTLRTIWDELLKSKDHRIVNPWMRRYARPMVLLFRELQAR